MKPTFKIVPFLLILCFPVFLWAVETYIEYGEIIEVSGGENDYIQVRDKILKVTSVFRNGEDGTLVEVSGNILKMGDIVQCFIGEDKDDYWETEKIVLLEGSARQKYLNDSETVLLNNGDSTAKGKKTSQSSAPSQQSTTSEKQKKETKKGSKLIFENGVWKN